MDLRNPFAELADRTAVVTGAARGIGLAVATALRDIGMVVVLVDRDGDELTKAAAGLNSLTGPEPVGSLVTDLSSDACLTELTEALQTLPPPAVWVNNAGRVSHQSAEEVDLIEFEQVVSDNTSSALRGSQAAFRAFVAGGRGGTIVNIVSLVTEKALPQRLSYSTSKAALENITRYTATEWGPHGIRVNAISPGYIETRLTAWPDDDPRAVSKRATLAALPLRRAGTTEDIAHTVLYLASPLSSYVTGQTIYLAGGWQLT
jgi:NAD(P)-dependent dehydrogenase (short-subunit alcohol dehydrogenase family)